MKTLRLVKILYFVNACKSASGAYFTIVPFFWAHVVNHLVTQDLSQQAFAFLAIRIEVKCYLLSVSFSITDYPSGYLICEINGKISWCGCFVVSVIKRKLCIINLIKIQVINCWLFFIYCGLYFQLSDSISIPWSPFYPFNIF